DGLGSGSGARQIDPDCRALPDLAAYLDLAAGLLDEAIGLAQSEASALPRLLGREKRMERLLLNFPRHSGTGIAHRDHYILPGRHACVLLQIALVDGNVAGLDRQLAAVGDR